MTQDTRPPAGSTGTLAELQVGPGDVVNRIIDNSKLWSGEKTITPEGWIVDNDGDAWGKGTHLGSFPKCSIFMLKRRATDETPDHIVTHEGRNYDLTALETPFGLLPEPVRDALQAWPHGVEMMTYSGQMIEYNFPDMKGKRGAVWRAKPAPEENRVECFRGERGVSGEYGTCVKRPDGSIDWSSWEPEA